MNVALQILISNLLVAGLLGLVATLLGWSGRRAPLAHLLWVAALLKLITPPIVLVPIAVPAQLAVRLQSASEIFLQVPSTVPSLDVALNRNATLDGGEASSTSGRAPAQLSSRPPVFTFSSVIIALWFIGAVTIFVRGTLRYQKFARLLRNDSQVDHQATQYVRQLLQCRQDESVPAVRRISAKISPMLFGMGKATTIVCSDALWGSLSESGRHAFLAHEVAHYQRKDHWVRWLEWFVTAVYWWLPFVYLARLQLERHEEAACDAWAIKRLPTSPRIYAETLLSVVDFLSESKARAPRLASRMQPTGSLEERLRLIMSEKNVDAGVPALRLCVLGLSGTLLLAHPRLGQLSASEVIDLLPSANFSSAVEHSVRADTLPPTAPQAVDSIELPPPPNGWWNAAPAKTWANEKLGNKELHLHARTGVGIGISQPGHRTFYFDPGEVCSLAYVAASNRLVIGKNNGELHLWDVDAQESVSLIGRHNAAITGLCYSARGGLVSGDLNGIVNLWDIQSGQLLASHGFDSSIASVRWPDTGDELAVLVGGWSNESSFSRLHMVPSARLRSTSSSSSVDQGGVQDGANSDHVMQSNPSFALPATIAVVDHDSELGWVALDWSGMVWSLSDGRPLSRIEKNTVSGIAFCPELMPSLKADVKRSELPVSGTPLLESFESTRSMPFRLEFFRDAPRSAK